MVIFDENSALWYFVIGYNLSLIMEDTMSKAVALYINAILFVFLASLCIASKPDASYEKIRAEFKQKMFERQQGIMAEEPYKAFIEPYIKEAEAKLQVPQYLMENPKSGVSSIYFNCLLNYNVAFFHAYARTYSNAQKVVAQY